jgi:elongation factor G
MFLSRGHCQWLCLVGNLKKWKEGTLSLTITHQQHPVTIHATRGGCAQRLSADQPSRPTTDTSHIIDFTWPEEFTFAEEVFGGSVPKNYFPAVEKGLKEACVHGVLAGYPVVNLKAVLYDGSYHPVDSSEIAFRTAAQLAYKAALPEANPVMLEPVGELKVTVPDSYMGDIIGDLNKRRGRVMGMDPVGGEQVITAEVPMAEMQEYAIDLRAMTQSRGSFTFHFVRYEEAPPAAQQKAIEDAKAIQED